MVLAFPEPHGLPSLHLLVVTGLLFILGNSEHENAVWFN
jgi:hypothetical protein